MPPMQPQWNKNAMKDILKFTKVRIVLHIAQIRQCYLVGDLRDWNELITYFNLLPSEGTFENVYQF